MKDKKIKFILAFFSMLIGILIATQMRAKVDSYAPVTVIALESTKNEIESINNEIEELNEIIETKEDELETLDNIYNSDEDIEDLLSENLEDNKMNSGKLSLEGPGITISMYDNVEERGLGFDLNDDIIHDIDILNIINDLRVAGAEAISINGERVLSTSEIKCAGPTIRINERRSATPFTIKAIGDPKLLIASVSAPDTNGDILKNVFQKGFDTTTEDSLTIPGYRGVFDFKYAKPLGEGE